MKINISASCCSRFLFSWVCKLQSSNCTQAGGNWCGINSLFCFHFPRLFDFMGRWYSVSVQRRPRKTFKQHTWDITWHHIRTQWTKKQQLPVLFVIEQPNSKKLHACLLSNMLPPTSLNRVARGTALSSHPVFITSLQFHPQWLVATQEQALLGGSSYRPIFETEAVRGARQLRHQSSAT